MPLTPAGAPPLPVQRAFLLYVASVVIGLVDGVVALVTTPSAAGATSGAALTGGIVGALIGLVFLALIVFCAVRLRQGENWARLTLAILGGISVLFTVLGLLGSAVLGASTGALSTVLGLVQAILVVAAIVFSYRPEANPWFARRLSSRAG